MYYCQYPQGMTENEAKAYVERAKRKYGESNIAHIIIRLMYNSDVEISVRLKDEARERIKRLSPEMVEMFAKGA